MASDQGLIIAKRSISLTKTYPIIGVFMTLLGAFFSGLAGVIGSVPTSGLPSSVNATVAANTARGVPFLAVPFQSLAAILFSMPVLLLFVYDKNNGVLEYLMSLGLNQGDIYRTYLKATLLLAGPLIASGVVLDNIVGAVEGTAFLTLEISGLVVAFALPAVAFGTLLMMSFSSLQKQRVGSNQPLGIALSSVVILPTYFLPLVDPSIAFYLDLILAAFVIGLSALTFSLSSRLIIREKLLP